jgi:uncharacterized protein DUF3455
MSYRTLKSKLFGTIAALAVAGMVLAGVATITAFTASSPQAATLGVITPPPLPDGMAPVPEGNKLFLGTHAVGTQNYVCQPSGAGVAYVLFTPQATLSGADGVQIITHYNSPNPDERNTDPKVVADGIIRATWQDKDTSRVWAKVHQPNGAVTVNEKAIAWLLLDAVGHRNGPTGGDKLAKTTFVQRLNTTGGLAPKTGCSSLADLGNKAFVPYTADYFFYEPTK